MAVDVDRRFLNCRFRRKLAWEEDSGGKVVVLRPRFGAGRIGRWLQDRFQSDDYRIRLDEMGSLVWKCCDQLTPADKIVERLRHRFGEKIEPAEDRLHQFAVQMHRAGMIEILS